MNAVWLALITGLTTGGISCFAVQGGLLASSLAQQKSSNHKTLLISFLASKVVAYTILGAFLGLLGSAFVVSPKLQGFMQILAGIIMLITVAQLLDIHPIFRRFVVQPPKAFFRIARDKSKENNLFTPAVLGFLTVLIPCGITQSMMLLSVVSGNAFWGALILGTFILGTSPVFYALGLASNEILKRPSLKYFAATAIFVLAIMSINTGQVLRGSVHTVQNYWLAAIGDLSKNEVTAKIAGTNTSGKQEVEIKVLNSGYQSNVTTLKAGTPVSIRLVTNNTQGCTRAFTIPEYNISKVLPITGSETVEFTPTKAGRLVITCSMGMYTGYFNVIES